MVLFNLGKNGTVRCNALVFLKRVILHVRRHHAFALLNGRLSGKTRNSQFEKKRRLLIKAGYSIGEGTKIMGPLFVSSNLVIGKNCWIGKDFEAQGSGTVLIGDNCDIAPGVTLNTGGHEIGDSTRRAGKGLICTIVIGSGTWICANVTVVKNTKIGSGCVIAAGAVVIKDVPDNSLNGGVPSKTIRSLDSASIKSDTH
jgi:acetyltransferase-like isoleucine patch superfamily enzyme